MGCLACFFLGFIFKMKFLCHVCGNGDRILLSGIMEDRQINLHYFSVIPNNVILNKPDKFVLN